MDADLVGSTAMDVSLGQESASDVKLAFRLIAKAEIEANFGTYRTAGDGVFAEFGLTHSAERAVLAAVRAALGIVRRLEANEGLVADLPVRPKARIGIHSGLTLVRLDERGILDYFGTTPDIAARLQASAQANEIWMSEDAYAAVRGYVRSRRLEPIAFRGLKDPLVVHVVEGERETAGLDGSAGGAASGFFGRSRELATLQTAFNLQANKPGRPLAVQVLGPGGIGKTRLLREFCDNLRQQGHVAIEVTCDPLAQGKSLAALVGAVSTFPGISLPDSATVDVALSTIGGLVSRLGSQGEPVAIVVDDAQFADRTTFQLFQRLATNGDPRLLLVFAAREPLPEFADSGSPLAQRLEPIVLSALDQADAVAVMQAAAGSIVLSDVQRASILSHADGVPLYLQELALAAGEETSPDWREKSAIPASLWPAMEARLAPGRAHREALRALSLFEGPIPASVVLAIVDEDEGDLLDRLKAAGIIRFGAGAYGSNCAYHHDLMRNAVYESITPRDQPALHQAAATTLIERFPAYTSGHPHVVARQFALAGVQASASRFYGLAGDLAQGHGAYLVAEDHYAKAFALAEGDDDLLFRSGQPLVRVQMINHGFGDAATVGATLARLGVLRA